MLKTILFGFVMAGLGTLAVSRGRRRSSEDAGAGAMPPLPSPPPPMPSLSSPGRAPDDGTSRHAAPAEPMMSQYLASLGHDLRSPLNAVIGFSKVLKDSSSLFDEESRHAGLINEAGYALLALINDVVELSKIEAGLANFVVGAVALPELLDETIAAAQADARARHTEITAAAAPAPLSIMTDAAALRRLVRALLLHAVSICDGRPVALTLRSSDGPQGAPDGGPDGAQSDAPSQISSDTVSLTLTLRIATPADAGMARQSIDDAGAYVTAVRPAGRDQMNLALACALARSLGGDLRSASDGVGFRFTVDAPRARPGSPAEAPLVLPPLPFQNRSIRHAEETSDAQLSGPGAGQLRLVPRMTLSSLRMAVQRLDLKQAEAQLDGIAPGFPALAGEIRQLLSAHRYRELCDALDVAIESQA